MWLEARVRILAPVLPQSPDQGRNIDAEGSLPTAPHWPASRGTGQKAILTPLSFAIGSVFLFITMFQYRFAWFVSLSIQYGYTMQSTPWGLIALVAKIRPVLPFATAVGKSQQQNCAARISTERRSLRFGGKSKGSATVRRQGLGIFWRRAHGGICPANDSQFRINPLFLHVVSFHFLVQIIETAR